MTVFFIILDILAGLFVLLICGIYFFLFKPNFDRHDEPARHIEENGYLHEFRDVINPAIDWFESYKGEEVYITSYDGLKLYAMLMTTTAEKCKGSIILCHGFHGIPPRDFAFLPEFYMNLGYNVLVINQRAHNNSEGKYLTFGVKERFDCRDWILYMNNRFGASQPVFLHGLSMGCATVLMTAGFDLPSNVKGIIADCGFTSPYEIILSVLKNTMKLPAFPIMPISQIMVKCIAKFGLKEYSTIDAMKTNKVPVLFICGEKDDFVPTWMTQKNYEACVAEKRIFWVKDAKHAESYFRDKDGFESQIKDFLSAYNKAVL